MDKKIEDASSRTKPHVMVFPFPIVGRTNPMFQFSKRLSSKGVMVTLATTPIFISNLLSESSPSLALTAFSQDFNEPPPDTVDMADYIERFTKIAPQSLARLIKEHDSHGNPVKCLVYDSAITWALDIAKELGIYAAPFFPQSCAVSLIFYHVFKGVMAAPPTGSRVSAPGLPLMGVGDLPSFVMEAGRYPIMERVILEQFKNFDKSDWQFFNSFHLLEKDVMSWMSEHWSKAMPIGPTIPSMYLDDRLEEDVKTEGDPRKPNGQHVNPNDKKCDPESWSQWLDNKEDKSAIYVSFGSMGSLGVEQMEELVLGLESTNKPFLWVIKTCDEGKLPPNFRERVSGRGKVVSWCNQIAVLGHRAVGCFFTHCGWNSTVEAISLGVPMVAMPQWLDQPTNAMFVEGVWRVGVRVKVDEEGIVRGEEIKHCVVEVMEGEKGGEMRRNAKKLKLNAKEAVEEGGSSDKNIEDFVTKIRS